MSKLLNKIQIPIKTRIATIFAAVIASLTPLLGLSLFDGSQLSIDFPIPLVLIVCCSVTYFGFFSQWKMGWYIGLGMFIAIFLFFLKLAFNTIFLGEFPIAYILLSSASFFTFALLIIDRKNYFAAIDEAKNKIRQI